MFKQLRKVCWSVREKDVPPAFLDEVLDPRAHCGRNLANFITTKDGSGDLQDRFHIDARNIGANDDERVHVDERRGGFREWLWPSERGCGEEYGKEGETAHVYVSSLRLAATR